VQQGFPAARLGTVSLKEPKRQGRDQTDSFQGDSGASLSISRHPAFLESEIRPDRDRHAFPTLTFLYR
jgi:hypothetical protein